MKTLNEVRNIISGSKSYEFNGPILTITSYFGGESVKLNLSLLNEEILDQLQVDDEDENDEEDW